MNGVKAPMSNSYKAVFVFSIFMIFFVIIMGAVGGQKGNGLGVFVWGYTAVMMYKRNNKNLAAFHRSILWIEGILFSAIAAIIISSESEPMTYIEIATFIGIALIAMGMSYGLFKFFQIQCDIDQKNI